MIGINKLNVNWSDDNHALVQDPDTGHEFNVTVRPKENMWSFSGHPVKSRLYVGGPQVKAREEFPLRQQTKWAREYFLPVLQKMLNNSEITMRFSRHAGCTMCPCSPGFIIEGGAFPFDLWMDAN